MEYQPHWHVYPYGSEELLDIHQDKQDTTINMRKNKDEHQVLMALMNKDLNGRCYKQTNSPDNKITNVYIYTST